MLANVVRNSLRLHSAAPFRNQNISFAFLGQTADVGHTLGQLRKTSSRSQPWQERDLLQLPLTRA